MSVTMQSTPSAVHARPAYATLLSVRDDDAVAELVTADRGRMSTPSAKPRSGL